MEKWGQMTWFSKLETLLKSSIKVYKLSKLYKFISLTDQPLAILWLERSLIFQHCTPIYGHKLCNFIISSSWQINPDKFFVLVEHVIFSAALPYMDKSLTSITGRGSISSLSAGLHKLISFVSYISYVTL